MNKQSGFSLIELLSILLLIIVSVNCAFALVNHYALNLLYLLLTTPISLALLIGLPIYVMIIFEKFPENKNVQVFGKILGIIFAVLILALAIAVPLILLKNYLLVAVNIVLLIPFVLTIFAATIGRKQ